MQYVSLQVWGAHSAQCKFQPFGKFVWCVFFFFLRRTSIICTTLGANFCLYIRKLRSEFVLMCNIVLYQYTNQSYTGVPNVCCHIICLN